MAGLYGVAYVHTILPPLLVDWALGGVLQVTRELVAAHSRLAQTGSTKIFSIVWA